MTRAQGVPLVDPVQAPGTVEYVYRHGEGLYVNLTSRCNLRCGFCFKFSPEGFAGHQLLMTPEQEPSVERAIEEVSRRLPCREIVFCGLGEPLLRADAVEAIGRHFRSGGIRVRVDTDGLYYLHGTRAGLARLAGCVDALSISLNAPDARTYATLCRPADPPQAFAALLELVVDAVELFAQVRATVVELPGLDIDRCRWLAAELGVGLVVRPHVPTPDCARQASASQTT